jgi:hypothetical protein
MGERETGGMRDWEKRRLGDEKLTKKSGLTGK